MQGQFDNYDSIQSILIFLYILVTGIWMPEEIESYVTQMQKIED